MKNSRENRVLTVFAFGLPDAAVLLVWWGSPGSCACRSTFRSVT